MAQPLWSNQAPSADKVYASFDTLGVSNSGSNNAVGSVSYACLSCHDGVQAMASSFNLNGASYTVGQGREAVKVMMSPEGSGAGLSANGIDPTFDHPIGVKYAGGGYQSVKGTRAISYDGNDVDFASPVNAFINESPIWWVDTSVGFKDVREKTDLQLYTRSEGPEEVLEAYVECASCHDPHNNNANFLRIENRSSTLCFSCHIM